MEKFNKKISMIVGRILDHLILVIAVMHVPVGGDEPGLEGEAESARELIINQLTIIIIINFQLNRSARHA